MENCFHAKLLNSSMRLSELLNLFILEKSLSAHQEAGQTDAVENTCTPALSASIDASEAEVTTAWQSSKSSSIETSATDGPEVPFLRGLFLTLIGLLLNIRILRLIDSTHSSAEIP